MSMLTLDDMRELPNRYFGKIASMIRESSSVAAEQRQTLANMLSYKRW